MIILARLFCTFAEQNCKKVGKTMNNRFYEAREYLLDLLRTYGRKKIVVKIGLEGEEIKVTAKSFVIRQLSTAGISFPFASICEREIRKKNPAIERDLLSIIFHEALFEFETAYIEEFCLGKPRANDFIDSVFDWIERKREWLSCTFSPYEKADLIPFLDENPIPQTSSIIDEPAVVEVEQEALKSLNEMGYTSITNVMDMQRLFWDFAIRRKPIDKHMVNAIVSITTDDKVLGLLQGNCKAFNRFLQYSIDLLGFKPETAKSKEKEKNRIIMEINTKVNAAKKEERRKNEQVRREWKIYRKISRQLKHFLQNPKGVFLNTYDLTNEKDIGQFLIWYKIWKRKVPDGFVRSLEKYNVNYLESGKLDLFKQMVEVHNAKYLNVLEEEDDDDED